ncbi:hypothetical protein [Mastigocladopsis repens]|uniref:hypothetical protein n=1 Tax=Mastigocladopsis repens TaxID=221287 RepID=UPI00030EC0DE|nr:hypothetical protein [Mastigocladopsis repens]
MLVSLEEIGGGSERKSLMRFPWGASLQHVKQKFCSALAQPFQATMNTFTFSVKFSLEEVYGDDPNGRSPRVDQGESGRWRCFMREDIAKRGENLDITWLRDESLHSGDDLPEPDVIAAAIMVKLQTAMEEMEALTALLEGEEETEEGTALLE